MSKLIKILTWSEIRGFLRDHLHYCFEKKNGQFSALHHSPEKFFLRLCLDVLDALRHNEGIPTAKTFLALIV